MIIHGVAMLAACLLVGMVVGDALGVLLGVDSNVGGVGFAMLLLIVLTDWLRRLDHFPPHSADGILFWSAMHIPIVVAMAATQNVVSAVRGGPIALLAGVGAALGCRDEQLHRPSFAGLGVDDVDRVARKVDEDFLAAAMRLSHPGTDPALPGIVVSAEPGVAEAKGMGGAILLPEQGTRHAQAPQFPIHGGPVGHGTSAIRHRRRCREQQQFEIVVRQRIGQRPGQPGLHGPARHGLRRSFPNPSELAIARSLSFRACLDRSTSRIDSRSVGILVPPLEQGDNAASDCRPELPAITWNDRPRSAGMHPYHPVEHAA